MVSTSILDPDGRFGMVRFTSLNDNVGQLNCNAVFVVVIVNIEINDKLMNELIIYKRVNEMSG